MSGTLSVDQAAELLDSTWLVPTRAGSRITIRHIVTDGRAYFRSTAGEEAEAVVEFTELDPTGIPALLEFGFTAYGRLGPSLDRLLLFIDELPMRAVVERVDSVDRVVLAIDSVAVVELLRETGLEQTGHVLPHEPVLLDITIDEGRPTRLIAAGTQFHDGEAVELSASIDYTPIDPFRVEPPATP